jgi:chaperone BCS1
MDVWIEFKNASKWQAEALFRNFFPSTEDDEDGDDEGDITLEGGVLDGIDLPNPPSSPTTTTTTASTTWSLSQSRSSSSTCLSSPPASSPSPSNDKLPTPMPLGDFGSKNTAYLPPPVEEHIAASQHSAKPLDAATLAMLAKRFADAIPDEEFSVAALQGCESVAPRGCLSSSYFFGFVF